MMEMIRSFLGVVIIAAVFYGWLAVLEKFLEDD